MCGVNPSNTHVDNNVDVIPVPGDGGGFDPINIINEPTLELALPRSPGRRLLSQRGDDQSVTNNAIFRPSRDASGNTESSAWWPRSQYKTANTVRVAVNHFLVVPMKSDSAQATGEAFHTLDTLLDIPRALLSDHSK